MEEFKTPFLSRRNRQFSPRIITQSSISSLNYETVVLVLKLLQSAQFHPWTAKMVILVLKLSHPAQIHPWSIAKYLFTLLLFIRTTRCWQIGLWVVLPWDGAGASCLLRWARPHPIHGLPPPRLRLRSTPADAGGGAGVVDLVGQQAARLEGTAFVKTTTTVRSRGNSGFPNS
jgi:hypothetical protein